MTAQGKDEVRHPGYAIPLKNHSALKGRRKSHQTIFVRPFQGRNNVGANGDPGWRPSVLPWAVMWCPFRPQKHAVVF